MSSIPGTPAIDATHSRGRHRRAALGAIALGGIALCLAACGSSAPKVANLSSDHSAGAQSAQGAAAPSPAPGGGGTPTLHASMSIAGPNGPLALATAVKFADCVRSHGVPSFPDPDAQGAFQFTGNDVNVTRTSRFQDAMRTCHSLLHLVGGTPSPARQAQVLAGALRYSACMRSHGVAKFPDPTSSPGGGVGLTIGPNSGIDPNSPTFQRAQQDCQSLQPGGPGNGP